MERITLTKSTQVKAIILGGLENLGYTLAKKTNCVDTPIYLFYNTSDRTVAVFNCKIKIDEFILVDFSIPGKIKVIIDEYKNFNDPCHQEVSAILEAILDGSFFIENNEVTFL